ncbi:hypothetical protein [Streptomyces sp. NPDC005805]|uniref:hypothetical protein n=1 Tax=Streptomyces sp. NPDC005805 TaxID=3157068 RepID=UPI0033FC5D6A
MEPQQPPRHPDPADPYAQPNPYAQQPGSPAPHLPQQPPGPPGFGAPAPAAAPRRGRGPVVAALVAGLVVGGGAVGAAWALTGGAASGEVAARDARGACAALADVDIADFRAEDRDASLVVHQRWSGAVTLAAAAAGGDPAHKPLADALSRASDRFLTTYEFDAQAKKEIATARRICDEL